MCIEQQYINEIMVLINIEQNSELQNKRNFRIFSKSSLNIYDIVPMKYFPKFHIN